VLKKKRSNPEMCYNDKTKSKFSQDWDFALPLQQAKVKEKERQTHYDKEHKRVVKNKYR